MTEPQTVPPERIAEIRLFDLTCLRTPTPPCRDRGWRLDAYMPMAVNEWCQHCIIRDLLSALDAAVARAEAAGAEVSRLRAQVTEQAKALEWAEKQCQLRAAIDATPEREER